MKDIIIDIIIAILDKVLPEAAKKLIPLVKVQPKRLDFIESKWMSIFSFFVYNRSKNVLFDIYLLIDLGESKAENYYFNKIESLKDLKIKVDKVDVNYQVMIFDCSYENDKEFILLKISQIDPNSFIPLEIKSNKSGSIKFKILEYSKKQNHTLEGKNEAAFLFEVPIKGKGKINLKGIRVIMKRN